MAINIPLRKQQSYMDIFKGVRFGDKENVGDSLKVPAHPGGYALEVLSPAGCCLLPAFCPPMTEPSSRGTLCQRRSSSPGLAQHAKPTRYWAHQILCRTSWDRLPLCCPHHSPCACNYQDIQVRPPGLSCFCWSPGGLSML